MYIKEGWVGGAESCEGFSFDFSFGLDDKVEQLPAQAKHFLPFGSIAILHIYYKYKN